jgi:hypothetical protein
VVVSRPEEVVDVNGPQMVVVVSGLQVVDEDS